MSLYDLSFTLLLDISESLAFKDLSSWMRTDRYFFNCVSSLLYGKATPYKSSLTKVSNQDLRHEAIHSRGLIIIWAAKYGYINTIKNVLAMEDIRPYINHPVARNGCALGVGSLGMTPLHQAALHGHVDIIELLIENGADCDNAVGGHLRPIHLARNEAVVRCLVSHGSSIHLRGREYMAPLTYAISAGAEIGAIQCFLGMGSDPNNITTTGISAGDMALRMQNLEALELLLKAGLDVSDPMPEGGSLIYRAIDYLQPSEPDLALKFVQLLLDYGAPAHGGKMVIWGDYAFHTLRCNLYQAVSKRNPLAMVKLLLSHGARVGTGYNFPGEQNWSYLAEVPDLPLTPILKLALHETKDWRMEHHARDMISTMSELITHGSRIDRPWQQSPLVYHVLFKRVGYGQSKVIQFLMEHGMNPFLVGNEFGTNFAHRLWIQFHLYSDGTSLDFSEGFQSVTERLLKSGLDPNYANDGDKKSLLMQACDLPLDRKARAAIETLIRHGANVNQTQGDFKYARVALDYVLRKPERYCPETLDRFKALLFTRKLPMGERQFPPLFRFLRDKIKPEQRIIRNQIMTLMLEYGADIHAKIVKDEDRIPEDWIQPPVHERKTCIHCEKVVSPYCDFMVNGTALHVVCNWGGSQDPSLVTFLAAQGAIKDVNSTTDLGFTPLLVLARTAAYREIGKRKFVAIKKLLIDAGADIEATTLEGMTAWDICVTGCRISWMQDWILGDLKGDRPKYEQGDWVDYLEDWRGQLEVSF